MSPAEGDRAGADSTPPVFLVDTLPDNDVVPLDGDEARHAVTVRRIRTGERLTLSDGAGTVAETVVAAVQPGREPRLELRVLKRWHEPEPALRVTIAQALAKGDRGELAVELATEAGVDAVLPWRAARSVARWDDGPRGTKALGRWRTTARAAAKQARRARVPEVGEPVSTKELAAVLGGADLALVLDAAGAPLTGVELPAAGHLVLVVGPEGGIAADESATFRAAGALPVRLGPSVLRTSTAGVVALGALGPLTARWR